ncbi:hypothetical protein E2C01_039007 [Portunus trituberculatus]|uniref:Uncharacterized protein n=1 Tax=Portunus trituberculatus TaxID=210409 RepID=A0A5B7FDN0_PORTR|nr:hypothetical protein [Portunus trituberculatus]
MEEGVGEGMVEQDKVEAREASAGNVAFPSTRLRDVRDRRCDPCGLTRCSGSTDLLVLVPPLCSKDIVVHETSSSERGATSTRAAAATGRRLYASNNQWRLVSRTLTAEKNKSFLIHGSE